MILWLRCSWINISSTNIYQASSLISKMWKQKYYSPYFRAPRDPHRMLTTWKLLWKCNWQNIPSTATRVCTQRCFCQGSSILTLIKSDQSPYWKPLAPSTSAVSAEESITILAKRDCKQVVSSLQAEVGQLSVKPWPMGYLVKPRTESPLSGLDMMHLHPSTAAVAVEM